MNLPNKLTLLRICLIPVFAVLFFVKAIPLNYVFATIVFCLAAFTDFLDGYFARKLGLVTNLGKFLDPIADKVLVSTAMILLLTVPEVLPPVIGAICVTALFVAFVTRGIIIAVNSPDKFSSLSAFGIVTVIGLQYLINIAVVTSTIPNTGMQLPFFSSGGSSFVFIMAAMGVLLNISRYQKKSSKLLKENKK